jgi:hypothetical protein
MTNGLTAEAATMNEGIQQMLYATCNINQSFVYCLLDDGVVQLVALGPRPVYVRVAPHQGTR